MVINGKIPTSYISFGMIIKLIDDNFCTSVKLSITSDIPRPRASERARIIFAAVKHFVSGDFVPSLCRPLAPRGEDYVEGGIKSGANEGFFRR